MSCHQIKLPETDNTEPAEEQGEDSSPLVPVFLLLCLLYPLSANEGLSSQEHKCWDLSGYHKLGLSGQVNTLLHFTITASVSQSVCQYVRHFSLFFY